MSRSGLGERAIIRRLTSRFQQSRQKLPLGFDDDASAYPMSRRKWLILKTDSLVGSTDIPPGMSLEQASRKAVVSTVSDFAAKGVQPLGLLISMSLRPPVRTRTVAEIARGIFNASRAYHCPVIGGDTGESTDFVIDCMGFGFSDPRKLIRRDNAKPGDVIAVTGPFGRTSAGVRILLSKNKSLARRFPRIVRSVTDPVARLEPGLRMAEAHIVNSSMDSSDGLAWTLHEIATLSRVSMVLDKIPVAADVVIYANQHGLDPEAMALYGGEEYELVITLPSKNFAALKRKNPSLIRIGTVARGDGEVRLQSRGEIRQLEPRGWEHMTSGNP